MLFGQTCKFGFLICIKKGPIREQNRHFLHISGSPPWSQWRALLISTGGYIFSILQTVHLNSFPFYHTPDWGFLLALDWWQQTFVDRWEYRVRISNAHNRKRKLQRSCFCRPILVSLQSVENCHWSQCTLGVGISEVRVEGSRIQPANMGKYSTFTQYEAS